MPDLRISARPRSAILTQHAAGCPCLGSRSLALARPGHRSGPRMSRRVYRRRPVSRRLRVERQALGQAVGRWKMSGPSTFSLIAAAVLAFVPFAAQAQEQGRPAAAAARRRQGHGRGGLHPVPSDQHDHRQLRLHPRRLERAGRHDDRPVAEPGVARHDYRVPCREFPAQHPAGAQAHSRPCRNFVHGMADADARSAFARSDPGRRRLDLVGGAVRQPDRAAQSRDRGDEGIQVAAQRVAALRVAR